MEHKLVKQRVSFGKGKSARRKQLLLARVCNKKDINNDSDSDSTIIYQPDVSESHHDHTDVNNNNDGTPTRSELKLGYMRSTPSKCSESNAGRSCLWWPYNYEI